MKVLVCGYVGTDIGSLFPKLGNVDVKIVNGDQRQNVEIIEPVSIARTYSVKSGKDLRRERRKLNHKGK